MEWVSVKEILPEIDRWVLVFADNRISIGQYCKYTNHDDKSFWHSQSSQDSCCSCDGADFKEVTHWMPLPSCPE